MILEPEEAELAKLFTNTWRYIKFATANQLYMMANDFGLDYERIRSAVTYNYPRAADLPGAGFAAGPCLFKDTMQLAAFNNNNFHLGQASVMINEGLPLYVVARLEQRYDLSNMTVGMLGMAFKAESDDIRSSLSYKLRRILRFKAQRVLCHDPYVTVDPDFTPIEEILSGADLLVIGTPHTVYADSIPSSPSSTSGTCARTGSGFDDRLRGAAPRFDCHSRLQRGRRDRRRAWLGSSRASRGIVKCSWSTTTRPIPRSRTSTSARLATPGSSHTQPPRSGPARAIRYGIDKARAPVVVVTMADGSDDVAQVDELCRLVDRGVVVAAASRYTSGGQQIGGPVLKSLLSRLAGLSLYWFARVGTRDATNSFKAYSTEFVREVGIESDTGFEIGIELVAKARRLRRPVAEVPTIWLERAHGASNFKVVRWIPRYLRWYRFAFGPDLTVGQLHTKGPPPRWLKARCSSQVRRAS